MLPVLPQMVALPRGWGGGCVKHLGELPVGEMYPLTAAAVLFRAVDGRIYILIPRMW